VRVCTVDIGTNSVRALVADVTPPGRIEVLRREGTITRLGQKLSGAGRLLEPAIERTATAVHQIILRARRLGAKRFKLVATSAARNASNAGALTERIRELSGLDVEIISGMEEAKYVCHGAVSSLDIAPSHVLFADIGGGSTELISLRQGKKPVLGSVEVGAVFVTERFIDHDPPLENELSSVLAHTAEELRETLADLPPGAHELIGLGGTITTVPPILMEMEKYDASRVHNYVITMSDVDTVLRQLSHLPLMMREDVKGLEPQRADIIIGGLLVLKALMEVSGFEKLRVSDRGILFGLALSLLPEAN
jgi:exopolyphosphatase/guanosine-5'-triphosphate,3'-diphosphate pyrophosphatase